MDVDQCQSHECGVVAVHQRDESGFLTAPQSLQQQHLFVAPRLRICGGG
ncbi:MAG: hypothetical protein JOZ87_34795 [Chloroflexi bacterium]|nr:hypothetical protein [Chloroflexota bacterium]